MIQYFPIVTGSLTVLGNINVSGSITTSGSITISGSITSASFASTASYWSGSIVNAESASFASTASFVALAQSASNAVSAVTASFANNLTVAGTLTAQTIVVQTITSSVIYSSGSNVFGNNIANTQVMTGSVLITGSVGINQLIPSYSLDVSGTGRFTNSIKYTGTGNILDASSGNTSYLYQYLVNTGGGLYFGIERNTGGGLFTNSSAYATVLGSTTATSLQFATNGIIRATISSSGDIGINTTTITNPNGLDKVLEIKSASSVGFVLNDSRDANPIGLENRGAVFHLTYGTKNLITSDGASGKLTVNTYANMTGGTFNVSASTTKTVTVSFTGSNIHAFLGFSSASGGITGAGSKSIFLGGATGDGSGHTPTTISTFSYGDQAVGAATTNTSTGFTFTITNNKGSAVSWTWSAFGSYGSITVS